MILSTSALFSTRKVCHCTCRLHTCELHTRPGAIQKHSRWPPQSVGLAWKSSNRECGLAFWDMLAKSPPTSAARCITHLRGEVDARLTRGGCTIDAWRMHD
eukprot:6193451-Pleurochrysis_carterae.AAC.1